MRLDLQKSPYGPLHATAAGAALVYIMIGRLWAVCGFGVLWHVFLFGIKIQPDAGFMLKGFVSSAALFGCVWLVAWASTLFMRTSRDGQDCAMSWRDRGEGVWFALRWTVPLTAAVIAVSIACSCTLEWLTGVKLADQPLVELLRSDIGFGTKVLVALPAILEAPILEELVFRGVVFRGLARSMPPWGAIALSGFVFALVHVNAATFIPLWMLGAAFAWLYWRTGTLLAPIAAHFLFNLINFFTAFLPPCG